MSESTTTSPRPWYETARGRVKIGCITGGLVLIVAYGPQLVTGAANLIDPPAKCQGKISKSVNDGESVWSVAQNIKGADEVDVQDIVSKILADNKLKSTNIPVGTSLEVPEECK
jgi:hypothetical protein